MEPKTRNRLLFVTGGLLFTGLLAANRQPIVDGVDKAMRMVLSESQKAEIAKLHPDYRERFREFINEVQEKLGWNVIITSGYRDFKKQIQLKAENPSNAAPGKSMHNYGLALDLNLQKGTVICKKADPDSKWEATGVPKLAREKYGFTWGGDFKTYQDPVHFGMDHKLDMAVIYANAIKQYGKLEKIIGNQVKLPPLLKK